MEQGFGGFEERIVFRNSFRRPVYGADIGTGNPGGGFYQFFGYIQRKPDIRYRFLCDISAPVYHAACRNQPEYTGGGGYSGGDFNIYEGADAVLFPGGGLCRGERVSSGYV